MLLLQCSAAGSPHIMPAKSESSTHTAKRLPPQHTPCACLLDAPREPAITGNASQHEVAAIAHKVGTKLVRPHRHLHNL